MPLISKMIPCPHKSQKYQNPESFMKKLFLYFFICSNFINFSPLVASTTVFKPHGFQSSEANTSLQSIKDSLAGIIEQAKSFDRSMENDPFFAWSQNFNFSKSPTQVEFADALSKHINKYKDTPLHIATKHNDIEFARQLLALKVNADARNSKGLTPLFFAAHNGFLDIVETLLAHGAKPNNAYDQFSNQTALDVTLEKLNLHATSALDAKTATEQFSRDTALTLGIPLEQLSRHATLEQQYRGIALALLDHGAGPITPSTLRDCDSFPSLTMITAASTKHPDVAIMHKLIKAKFDVNKADFYGYTALHAATMYNNIMTAYMLLACGAHANASVSIDELQSNLSFSRITNEMKRNTAEAIRNNTPLKIAVSNKQFDLAFVLLAHDASSEEITTDDQYMKNLIAWCNQESNALAKKTFMNDYATFLENESTTPCKS